LDGFTTPVSQLQCADYTDRIVQSTLAAPIDNPRPKGVSLTALLLLAFGLHATGMLVAQFSYSSLGFCYGGLMVALESYSLWSYWKGQNWARLLVLIVSCLVVAAASNMMEREGSLIALMSHPVFFLRFAVAAFLLYWLNTRPLRAWFKNAATAADLISEHLEGKLCIAIANSGAAPDQVWRFAFEHDAELTLTCPWRIVLDDNLAFASNPGPGIVNDEREPQQLLQNIRVQGVRVTPRTSDLFVIFEMGLELQTWSIDSKSQQWEFSDPNLTVKADSKGLNLQTIAAPVPTEDSPAND